MNSLTQGFYSQKLSYTHAQARSHARTYTRSSIPTYPLLVITTLDSSFLLVLWMMVFLSTGQFKSESCEAIYLT